MLFVDSAKPMLKTQAQISLKRRVLQASPYKSAVFDWCYEHFAIIIKLFAYN